MQLIDSVQATFKEAVIPVQLIETDDRGKVAIVFERVNRLGVELDTLQLLSAWTWSDEFDLQERFRDLSDELRPFGFGGVGEDTNLLLRCCAAVVAGDVSAPTLLGLNGAEVRSRFDEIANGLRGAIDFVRSNVHVEMLENLPYPAMLVPLTVFFAARDGVTVTVTDTQRSTLLDWFWRSCFGRRFSSGVLRNLNRDVAEARKLRATETSALAGVPSEVLTASWFMFNRFSVSAVNTKTFVLMLAQQRPRSFVSGMPVDLRAVLQSYNRSEFHHLYPRAYLSRVGGARFGLQDCLANFAMISSADNKVLGGVAPSVYRVRMARNRIDEILRSAVCPVELFNDKYSEFVRARGDMLVVAAKSLAGW